MNHNYETLLSAMDAVRTYELMDKMFKGIDDEHCQEAKNKAAHLFNAAISKLNPLQIVTVRPLSQMQTKSVVSNMVQIAEEHSKHN